MDDNILDLKQESIACNKEDNMINKLEGNGYDLIFDSSIYPFLCSNIIKLSLNITNNGVDITDKLYNSAYYVICGGSQVYTNTLNNESQNNLYPVENIPFGLLIYHEIVIYFEIPPEIQNELHSTIFNFSYKTFDLEETQNMVEIKWPNQIDPHYEQQNYLRFLSGMCGMTYGAFVEGTDEFNCISHSDIYNFSSVNSRVHNLKFTKVNRPLYQTRKVGETNMIYLASNESIALLVEASHDHGSVAVFDTVYYKFSTLNSEYSNINMKIFLGNFDSVTNFSIISQNELNNPTIILDDILINSSTEIHNEDNSYTYRFKDFNYIRVINRLDYMTQMKNRKSWIKINNLVPGTYILKVDRIFVDSAPRRALTRLSKITMIPTDPTQLAYLQMNSMANSIKNIMVLQE